MREKSFDGSTMQQHDARRPAAALNPATDAVAHQGRATGRLSFDSTSYRSSSVSPHPRLASLLEPRSSNLAGPRGWRGRCWQIYDNNKAIGLMVIAQFFGAANATMARLLENPAGRPGMHTFQVSLLARFLVMRFAQGRRSCSLG